MRVAGAIALGDKEYGAGESDVIKTQRAFYKMLVEGRFIPNSPTLMNAGVENRLQYSACYVLPVEDSIKGIFESIKNAANVHKSGGGTGFSFTRLRPKDWRVNTSGGVASGPVSFMRVFDSATEAIKQGGRRRGANMGVLRVDHPDIEEFIGCKLDGGISNFNISVAITNAFMVALEDNRRYDILAQPEWPGPDGSRYKGGEVIGQKNAQQIFSQIVDAAWQTGDPGLIFIDRINNSPANPTPAMGLIESTNPCITGDTLIYTETGLVEARSLYYDGNPVRITSDSRQGAPLYQQASYVFSTGEKQVFKLSTKEGYMLRLTANHQVMTKRGWVAAKDLGHGDRIHILNRKGGFGTYGSRDIGLALGWLVGDGTIKKDRAVLSFFGQEKQELAPMFAETVNSLVEGMQQRQRDYLVTVVDVSGRDEARVQSARLKKLAGMYGLTQENKHIVPHGVLVGTEAMQRGFLQALFSADGTVYKGASRNIRLSQSDMLLLEQVQMLLLNFGIASKIYKNRRKAGCRPMPDGKGGLKEYHHKAQHELMISKCNMALFLQEIGFISPNKQAKLREVLSSYENGPKQEVFTARFESFVQDGVEEVFDLNEPKTHSFVGNGLVLHNCGEQPLLPNESCNLGSINLTKFVDKRSNDLDWDVLTEVIKTAVHFLDNVITVNPYPSSEINQAVKDNRRIGLGVMGWADLLFTLQIPYNSQAALDLADKVMSFINRIGHEKSAELAKIRGNFPAWPNSIFKEQGPMRNSTVTTIAPTGSISIIAGASSGIEPIFALAFRHVVKQPEGGERVLIFINPVFERLAKAHGFWSKELEAKILKTGSVRGLKEVPEDFQAVFVTAHEVGVHWHVNMQAAFQRHTDNGVSKTINMSNDATHQEIKDAYLLAYTLGCLGITVFRDGCKNTQVLHIGGSEKPALSVRPMKLQGITYRKNTPIGTCYITVNEDINTGPFEVFINVGRAGSAIAADAEALGRLISLIFRSSKLDKRIQDVIAQLRGIGSGRSSGFGANRVMSLADAVAQVLAEHAGIGTDDKLPGLPDVNSVSKVGDLCPDCGQATFVFEEGCQKCYLCGYSEC